ncbi:MAG: hypothetical protein M0P01_08270, partial [Treponema sp.]|nr:hypothetical protein [Treponema sp.]
MAYIILNFVLAAFLVWLTIYIDRASKIRIDYNDPLVINVLIAAIISVVYSILICNFLPSAFF